MFTKQVSIIFIMLLTWLSLTACEAKTNKLSTTTKFMIGQMMAKEKQLERYGNRICLFGDSRFQQMNENLIGNNVLNYGIGSQTAAELAISLDSFTEIKRCRAIILLVGVNDVNLRQGAQLPTVYFNILSKLAAGDNYNRNPPIIFIRDFSLYTPARPYLTYGAIRQENADAETACMQFSNCTFAYNFKLPDSLLRDKVHPTTEGYEALAKYIRWALYIKYKK